MPQLGRTRPGVRPSAIIAGRPPGRRGRRAALGRRGLEPRRRHLRRSHEPLPEVVPRSPWRRGPRRGAGPRRRAVRQRADGRHQRRLLSARRRARQRDRQGDARRQDVGPVDEGLGREPEPAAGGARRDRVHARRLAIRRLEGQRGGRLQGAAEEAARRRGDLSQLHPDRRPRRRGNQDDRRPQGQEDLGRARRNPAPSSTRAPSSARPASRTRTSRRSSTCRSANRSS